MKQIAQHMLLLKVMFYFRGGFAQCFASATHKIVIMAQKL